MLSARVQTRDRIERLFRADHDVDVVHFAQRAHRLGHGARDECALHANICSRVEQLAREDVNAIPFALGEFFRERDHVGDTNSPHATFALIGVNSRIDPRTKRRFAITIRMQRILRDQIENLGKDPILDGNVDVLIEHLPAQERPVDI